MEFSKEKFIEILELITEKFLSSAEVEEVQIKFTAGYYSGNSILRDEDNGKIYKLTATISPNVAEIKEE